MLVRNTRVLASNTLVAWSRAVAAERSSPKVTRRHRTTWTCSRHAPLSDTDEEAASSATSRSAASCGATAVGAANEPAVCATDEGLVP